MMRTRVLIAGCAVAAVIGACAWQDSGWKTVPTALRVAEPGNCRGAMKEKTGRFELQWQSDGRLKIETWVVHKGGDTPDPRSAKASWRDSQIRLAYSTVQPKATACLEFMKLEFQLDRLPRKDYQVAWDSWTSFFVAGR